MEKKIKAVFIPVKYILISKVPWSIEQLRCTFGCFDVVAHGSTLY